MKRAGDARMLADKVALCNNPLALVGSLAEAEAKTGLLFLSCVCCFRVFDGSLWWFDMTDDSWSACLG